MSTPMEARLLGELKELVAAAERQVEEPCFASLSGLRLAIKYAREAIAEAEAPPEKVDPDKVRPHWRRDGGP